MPTLPAAGYNTPDAPTIGPSPDAGTPYQSGAAAEGAFGALTAKALSGLSTAFDKAATHVENIQTRYDFGAGDEQANLWQDRVNDKRYGDRNNPNDLGFNGLDVRGKMDGYKTYLDTIDKLHQEHRAKLRGGVQQERFDERTRVFRRSVMQEAGKEYADATQKFRAGQAEGRINRSLGEVDAAVGKGEEVNIEEHLAETFRWLDEDGPTALNMTPEQIGAKKQELREKTAVKHAEKLALTDPLAARRFAERNEGILGDNFAPLMNRIEERADKAEVDERVSGIARPGGGGGGPRVGGGPRDSVDTFLDLAAQHESGWRNIHQGIVGPKGGYNPSTGTVTGPSSAQGYFQIVNSTWKEFAPGAGVDLAKYPNAMSAPYEVQRAVARNIATTSGVQHWTDYNKSLRASVLATGLPVSGPITGRTPTETGSSAAPAAAPASAGTDAPAAARPATPAAPENTVAFYDQKIAEERNRIDSGQLSPREARISAGVITQLKTRRAELAQAEPGIEGELTARVGGKQFDAARLANAGDTAGFEDSRAETERMIDAETNLSADKRELLKKRFRQNTAISMVEALALRDPVAADQYADAHQNELADKYREAKTTLKAAVTSAQGTRVAIDVMSGRQRDDQGERVVAPAGPQTQSNFSRWQAEIQSDMDAGRLSKEVGNAALADLGKRRELWREGTAGANQDYEATIAANQAEAQAAANIGDMQAVNQQRADAMRTIEEEAARSNWTQARTNVERSKYIAEITKDVAYGMAARGDVVGADKYADENAAALGPHLAGVKDHLKKGVELAQVGQAVAGIVAGAETSGAPNLARWLGEAERQVRDGTIRPQIRDEVMKGLHREYTQWEQTTAQERARLKNELQDGMKALAAGEDYAIPNSEIQRLYPPEQAEQLMRAGRLATKQGEAVKQVQWASPEDIARQRERINESLKDTQDWEQKQQGRAHFEVAVADREKKLTYDPAAYVAASAPVQAAEAARKLDPENPELSQAVIDASLTEQIRLGAPVSTALSATGAPQASPPQFLTKEKAGALVQEITTADPVEVDLGKKIGELSQFYGKHWQTAFGELVQAGLPPAAKVIGAMDRVDQTATRVAYQRMISFVATEGGAAKMKSELKYKATEIDQAMPEKMRAWNSTVADPQMQSEYHDAVTNLAYWYARQGQDSATALQTAYDGILGRRYEFWEKVRTPLGLMPQMQNAADAALRTVTIDQVADPGPGPDPNALSAKLTPEQRRNFEFQAIQQGRWSMTENGTAWRRMAVRIDGAVVPAKIDGKPLEITFVQGAAMPVTPLPTFQSSVPTPPITPSLGPTPAWPPVSGDPTPSYMQPPPSASRYSPAR